MSSGALPTPETTAPVNPPSEPTRHHQDWRVLLALFLLTGIVESQAFGHLGAFTPLFLRELHVPLPEIPTWTGILQALGFVIGIPLLPFWGIWADRYSRKLIIVRSAYIEGILFTISAFSPNVYVLAFARFLSGFILGNTGVMLAMLADATPRKRLGLAIGIVSAGFPIGSSIGPYLGGQIAQHYGIRALLGVDGGLSALIGILLTVAIHDERRVRQVTSTVGRMMRAALHDIVSSPAVVRLFLLYFLAMFGISLTTPFIPILLQKLYGGNIANLPGVIGATLTAAGIAMAVMTPLWGRAGDWLGRWRVLPICLAAMAVAVACEGIAPTLFPLQAAIFGTGLFQGGIVTTIIALLALLAPEERRASILNFSLLPSQISWFIGPLSGAALAAIAIRLPFFVGAALLAGAVVLAVVAGRRMEQTKASAV